MTDAKRFHCTECGGSYLLVGGTLLEHTIAGRVCPGSRTVPKMGVEQLRPRGIGKTAEQEAWRHQEDLTASFVGDRYLVHVQQTEAQLKEMLQAAIKLVEENPRNEAIRTPIHRAAVERMLAEDLGTGSAEGCLGELLRAEVAKELFDAGWRPTIDRVVR